MQDVHITCILILEFMRKTPPFEFSTFSICIILQTVCIICLNNSSCSFQDTKLFQFSCTDSQHRDKHHTLIFDNYEKKRDYNYFGSDRPTVVFIISGLRIMFTQRKTLFAVPLTAFPLFFCIYVMNIQYFQNNFCFNVTPPCMVSIFFLHIPHKIS